MKTAAEIYDDWIEGVNSPSAQQLPEGEDCALRTLKMVQERLGTLRQQSDPFERDMSLGFNTAFDLIEREIDLAIGGALLPLPAPIPPRPPRNTGSIRNTLPG